MAWCNECGRQVEAHDLVAGPPNGQTPEAPETDATAPTNAASATAAAALTDAGGATDPAAGTDAGGATDPAAADRCPTCGAVVAPSPQGEEEEVPVKPPWHFKVLVVGTVVYLGYRLYQGVGWLIHHA
jgi:hypothetical protein